MSSQCFLGYDMYYNKNTAVGAVFVDEAVDVTASVKWLHCQCVNVLLMGQSEVN